MKAATVKQLKDELKTLPQEELLGICLRLSKFKKENKELLTYLLFEAGDEQEYIAQLKEEMDGQFAGVNGQTYYLMKKGVRKILTGTKRHIRYSMKKETEVELLIYYCRKLLMFKTALRRSAQLENIFVRQLDMAKKKTAGLHEDLQYDYGREIQELRDNYEGI